MTDPDIIEVLIEGPPGPTTGGTGGGVDLPIAQTDVTGLVAALAAKAPLTHTTDTANPHSVTKAQVGLSNADNTADSAKPVSTPQATALAAKADASALTAHTSNTSNPHSLTKAQIGLGNVDNTADSAKPVSTAQQTAINAAISLLRDTAPSTLDTLAEIDAALNNDPNFASTVVTALATKAAAADLTAHVADTANPHAVTKTQVGLSNVDNTSDANKPVSTAQATALAGKASTASLSAHTSDTANPHAVTKAQVGLSNVDNTADGAKPVSAAQQTALDAKSPITRTRNAQTGTSYTLAIGDAGNVVSMNNGSANTLTIPPNSSVAFPVGTQIDLVSLGAGQTTIAEGAGVNIRSEDSKRKLTKQYSGGTLLKLATDEWFLTGSIAA